MALYHSYDAHYDLLVKDDSRLALLGLLAGLDEEGFDTDTDNERDGWETVMNGKKNKPCKRELHGAGEKLLEEDSSKDVGYNDLSEEIILLNSKNSGGRRTFPMEGSVSLSNDKRIFPCDQCDNKLESQGLFDAHMKNNHEKNKIFPCQTCDNVFPNNVELEKHIKEVHEVTTKPEEWNCNDCSFQGSCSSELINHLKITGHSPSKARLDNRKIFKDFKQCYTCKKEFDGYWNLMNHRKSIHPSNKKCRNFPATCKFGEECWYVHVEQMETDQVCEQNTFKCKICGENFEDQGEFMKHMKTKHTGSNQACEKFLKGQCERDEEDCWFFHPADQVKQKQSAPNKTSQDQVFHQAHSDPFPPDQMSRMFWMVTNLCRKVEGMEKRFEELMI